MPRAPRIEFAGAIYHVMNRGNHLENIFRDDADRRLFLNTLGETCGSAGWRVHSFVLMSNHYHLLIETPRPVLVKGMQYLNSTYTQRYNVRHRTRGHLFQGRYKALLVDVEAKGYFLTVSDYIHLNPVRARKVTGVQELLRDPWNSAGWLGGMRKGCPVWLRWERVYGELGLRDWRSSSRRSYRGYLERRMGGFQEQRASWQKIRRGWCWGSDGFVAQMKIKLEELAIRPRDGESWAGEAVEELEEARAMRLIGEGARRLGYVGDAPIEGVDRFLLANLARERTQVPVGWLAQRFGLRTRGGMSYSIRQVRKRIQIDLKLKRRWKLLTS